MRQAEGWLTATSSSTVCSQPCLQHDESTARGVGGGGVHPWENGGLIPANRGGKADTAQCVQKKGSTF